MSTTPVMQVFESQPAVKTEQTLGTNQGTYVPAQLGSLPPAPALTIDQMLERMEYSPQYLVSMKPASSSDEQFQVTGFSMKPSRIDNHLRRAATDPRFVTAMDEIAEAKKNNKPFQELSLQTQEVVKYVEHMYTTATLNERRVKGLSKAKKELEIWEAYEAPEQFRQEEKKNKKKKTDLSPPEIRTVVFKMVPKKDKSGAAIVSADGKVQLIERRKPKPYVVDPYKDLAQGDHTRSLKLIGKMLYRFGENSDVAVTILCDSLIREMYNIAIKACKAAKKNTIQVAHLFSGDLSNAKYVPAVQHYKSWEAVYAKFLNGETGRNRGEEQKVVSKHKHPLDYNVSLVGKSVIAALKEEKHDASPASPATTNGKPETKSKMQTSSEFKQLCCNILDELIRKLGWILNNSLTLRGVKTVNNSILYEDLNAMFVHSNLSFAEPLAHINNCMKLYKDYAKPEEDDDDEDE